MFIFHKRKACFKVRGHLAWAVLSNTSNAHARCGAEVTNVINIYGYKLIDGAVTASRLTLPFKLKTVARRLKL